MKSRKKDNLIFMAKGDIAAATGKGENVSLWREIEETRLVEPAFEGMAARGSTAMLAVPQWMDGEHIKRLQMILRWGTRDRAVGVFGNVEDVPSRFDGVAILKDEAAGPADTDSSAGVLARITYGTVRALSESSSAVKKAISGKHGEKNRRLWNKLFTIDSYTPVHDPVYVAEAVARLITRPAVGAETVGAVLLVEHVKKAVESALREPVMEIIRKAIGGNGRTFEIDEVEISAAAALALAGADLGRFHEGLQGLPGTRLVSVDSPLVRSLILNREPERAARTKKKVLGILEGI